MSEEPDRPMNFAGTSTKLLIYRVSLVALCVLALMIWIETIEILGIVLLACLPGILNEQLKAQFGEQRKKFFIPGQFLAPYQLFIFVWNGLRSKKG